MTIYTEQQIENNVSSLADDTWGGAGDDPALVQAGMHLQKNRPGSREEYTA